MYICTHHVLPFHLYSLGNLVLDNLNLKAEALVGLDLPIEVKAGYIGELYLFEHSIRGGSCNVICSRLRNMDMYVADFPKQLWIT